MKLKKQKRHRKIVRFYTACFGFHDPFKVLCDGTFVHHLLTNQITPADTALANSLGAPVKMFTTRCVLAELKSLGHSYTESLNAAQNLLTARCDHEKRKTAVNCIADVIGEDNSEHFFVASQDSEFRQKLQEIPGVPVLFGLRNALFLERPSAFQHQFVKSAEEKRSHMTELEFKLINARKKSIGFEESKDSSDAAKGKVDHVQAQTTISKKRGDEKDKVQFKRKRAKGPNPLSCKKRKPKPPAITNTAGADSVKESGNTDTTMRSRSRKRKRSRKSDKGVEETA